MNGRIQRWPSLGHVMAARRTFLGIVAAVVAGLAAPVGAARAEPVTVFAAASLKNALDEAGAAWSRETGKAFRASYAASNALAKQLEAGAPADVFVSADEAWMDHAEKAGVLRPGTRVNLLGNRIVLVAPKGSAVRVELKPGLDLAAALGSGRLAMGSVDAVPAGKYGKAALEALGAWAGVRDRVAQAENVRAALLLVARGEAPLGIVYATDAAAEPAVRVVATFPADSHPPIVYPIAEVKESRNADAGALVAYLRSAAARPFFERQGFTVLAAPSK